ncbi:F-box protein [Nymphaea thermarum]|nr:F-box protein [Nymphaea thermarum]
MGDWREMTRECLVDIMTRLPLEDRWRWSPLVCRSWLAASRDPSLWRTVDLEPCFLSGGPEEQPRWWTPEFEAAIDAMLLSVIQWSSGGLKEVLLRHCSDRSLLVLVERSPELRALSIKSCPNVTDLSISKMAASCPMLAELDISFCYNVSHESLKLIGHNCPNLKVLRRNLLNWLDPSQHRGIIPAEYLNSVPQNGDEEAAVIAKFMPNLVHLELRFSKFSPNGLKLIVEGCTNLEILDLFGCANLTSRALQDAAEGLKNLKVFTRPNFYIPRSVFHTERYGHWRLYDERFQTNVFQI